MTCLRCRGEQGGGRCIPAPSTAPGYLEPGTASSLGLTFPPPQEKLKLCMPAGDQLAEGGVSAHRAPPPLAAGHSGNWHPLPSDGATLQRSRKPLAIQNREDCCAPGLKFEKHCCHFRAEYSLTSLQFCNPS